MSEAYSIKTVSSLNYTGSDDTSILESALNHGYHFEHSCKSGQCGVCKTSLLQGEVIELQPQEALTNEDVEAGKFLTCCCAPKTDILIEAEDLSALQGVEVKTLPARLNAIRKHSENIVEVELRLPPAVDFKFLEGQFIDVIGKEGVRRSYSIASCSNETTLQLFIKKVKNGVMSKYWFHQAKQNDLLRIEGPKGTFFLRDSDRKIIFLATGTGIAPVKAILDRLSEAALTEQEIFVYWGNRKKSDFFWEPNYYNLNVRYVPVVSQPDKNWSGKVGYVQDIALEGCVGFHDVSVYACGSLQMIESAHKLLVAKGLSEKMFYSDAFVSS